MCGTIAHNSPRGPRTGGPEGDSCAASAPRTAAQGGAEGPGVGGPGAGPGVGGRDWRLLLRVARAVSSLEPRCRRTARAGMSRRPRLGRCCFSRPPPPKHARTGTRPLASEPCDVKDVPVGRHFRQCGGGGGGAGRLAEAPPPPGPERTAPLAEAGSPGRSGTARRDGTGRGRGVWAACGAGVPRESQGRGVRLSVVAAQAQSVGAI